MSQKTQMRAEDMTPVVKRLPSKFKALSTNPITTKKKKKETMDENQNIYHNATGMGKHLCKDTLTQATPVSELNLTCMADTPGSD
jgi:hypothetical protein